MGPQNAEARSTKGADSDAARLGLAARMSTVLDEIARARSDLSPDAVHDLRVALRRCRSLAEGAAAVDAHRGWRRLRRVSRALFRQLGALRDAHVLAAWIERLAPPGDSVSERLTPRLREHEAEVARAARDALFEFDDDAWRDLASVLAPRAERLRPGSAAFRHLALERWTEARALHDAAVESGSGEAFHALRIGVKRFRYTVEDFLPEKHAAWSKSLRKIQDALGEMHDLDLLWGVVAGAEPPLSDEELAAWRDLLSAELESRIGDYHDRMSGDDSLWSRWRDELPSEEALPTLSFARIAAWAASRDTGARHARRVARLAGEIRTGLVALRAARALDDPRAERLLRAAALAHHVGRRGGRRQRHLRAYRRIREITPPLGWTEHEIEAVALVARYYRGGEPSAAHAGYRDLDAAERAFVSTLAGILRIADALDAAHDGATAHVRVEPAPPALVLRAEGYQEGLRDAARMGGRKRLLEAAIGRPILVLGTPRGERPAARDARR